MLEARHNYPTRAGNAETRNTINTQHPWSGARFALFAFYPPTYPPHLVIRHLVGIDEAAAPAWLRGAPRARHVAFVVVAEQFVYRPAVGGGELEHENQQVVRKLGVLGLERSHIRLMIR